jgi:2-oxoglutarate ferredoxin oxidoreductase subunit alpha
MVEKRMKKLELIDKEVPLQEKISFYGDEDSENLVFSWGSPKGAILEAMQMLKNEGISLRFMQLRMLHPLPKEPVKNALKKAKKIIDVEGNYLAQMAGILKEEVGIQADYQILKYTGRPISTTEMYEALRNILVGKAPMVQVLTYGS